jgi:hypothetical protein
MNFAVVRPLLSSLALVVAALALTGCPQTIRPTAVEQAQPSWHGNIQNSGVYGAAFDENGKNQGIVVDQEFVTYYTELIKIYGECFKPPMVAQPAPGVRPLPNTWTTIPNDPRPNVGFVIDAQYMVRYLKMNRWYEIPWTPRHGAKGEIMNWLGVEAKPGPAAP